MISANIASVLGLSGEWICPALHERARQAGIQVQVAVEKLEYFQARNAIDAAEADELATGRSDETNPLSASLAEIELDMRTVNKLGCHGIFTVGHVLGLTEEILLAIDGFGPGTVEQIRRAAAAWIGRPLPC
jgi:DNA-directed RNA polymerase alpha subunit